MVTTDTITPMYVSFCHYEYVSPAPVVSEGAGIQVQRATPDRPSRRSYAVSETARALNRIDYPE